MKASKTRQGSERNGQALVEFGICLTFMGLLMGFFYSVSFLTFCQNLLRAESFLKGRASLYGEKAKQTSITWPENFQVETSCLSRANCRTQAVYKEDASTKLSLDLSLIGRPAL